VTDPRGVSSRKQSGFGNHEDVEDFISNSLNKQTDSYDTEISYVDDEDGDEDDENDKQEYTLPELRSSSSCPMKGPCSDILHLDDHSRVKKYHQQALEKLEANPLYLAFKESKGDTPLVLSYDENHNPVTLFVMDTDKKEVKSYDVNKICTCNPKDYEHASIIQHHPNLNNYHIHINECNKALSGYLGLCFD